MGVFNRYSSTLKQHKTKECFPLQRSLFSGDVWLMSPTSKSGWSSGLWYRRFSVSVHLQLTQNWPVCFTAGSSLKFGIHCCIAANCITSILPGSLQVVSREPQSLGGGVSSHSVQGELLPGEEQPDLQERLLAVAQVDSCFQRTAWFRNMH